MIHEHTFWYYFFAVVLVGAVSAVVSFTTFHWQARKMRKRYMVEVNKARKSHAKKQKLAEEATAAAELARKNGGSSKNQQKKQRQIQRLK